VIVSSANYLSYLGIAAGDTTKATELAMLEPAVESRIKGFLCRDLEWTVYTDELYSGNGTSKLILRQFPIIYISSIKRYDGIASGAETWTTLVQYTDYDRLIIDNDAYSVFLDNGFFEKGNQNYKITYMAGYTIGADITSSTNLNIGKKYQIKAHSIVNFTTIGASANTVGTQFICTGTSVTLSVSDSLTELIVMPQEIQLACMEFLKIVYSNSSISGNGRLGFLNISDNAGGGSQNLNIDPEIENKILNKIIGHRSINV
jgi:hypothetical protein